MRKSRKSAPPAPETPAPYDSEALLRRTADVLGGALDSIEAGLGDESTEGMHQSSVRDIGELSRAISSITGELRAREKAAASVIKNLSRSQVLQYLQQLDAEGRAAIVKDLQAIDDEGSVLG